MSDPLVATAGAHGYSTGVSSNDVGINLVSQYDIGSVPGVEV
jgi:hypothetical protein